MIIAFLNIYYQKDSINILFKYFYLDICDKYLDNAISLVM